MPEQEISIAKTWEASFGLGLSVAVSRDEVEDANVKFVIRTVTVVLLVFSLRVQRITHIPLS